MRCSKCGITEGRFLKYSKRKSNQYYYCTHCNTERLKKYRQTKNGKDAIKRATNKYENKNRKKVNNWWLAGQYTEMKPCIICGEHPSHRHHPYKEEPLIIIYLCAYHHKQAHRQLEKRDIL